MMHSLLNQLQDDESLLLMYASDELSAEDRERVDERLAAEPALREQLERMQELNGSVDEALGRLDAGSRLPVSEGVAVRKVGRVMRKWQTDRMAPPPPQDDADGLRFPWWSYPLGAAAAILLAFIVWWGTQDGPPVRRAQRPASSEGFVASTEQQQQPQMMPFGYTWDDYLARRLWRSWQMYDQDALESGIDSIALSQDGLDDVEGIFLAPASEIERTW